MLKKIKRTYGRFNALAERLTRVQEALGRIEARQISDINSPQDAEFRVFEERLQPGDVRELHSHAQRLVVRLNQVQLTDPRHSPSGKPGTGIQVANTVKFAEPVVHAVKNLSNIPLFNIVIEFKIPH